MKIRPSWHALAIASALLLLGAAAAALAQQPPPPRPLPSGAVDEGIEVRTRGPIHEAFARPPSTGTVPELNPDRPPPGPVQEIPPPQRPSRDGEAAEWIPGYWGWEEDKGYVWVSGIWRYPPPEMRWVPGYWVEQPGGSRWVSGFWVRYDVAQMPYLPQPPAPRPEDPGPNPGEGYFWVPGAWIFQDNQYAWRPGFWAEARPDWVWVPCSYVWTPSGFLFVDGYWDHPLERRGVLFAPVWFRPGWWGTFSPTVVIDPVAILPYLFVHQTFRHYYFGDYFALAGRYPALVPWVTAAPRPGWYDPLWTYYQFRRPNIIREVRESYRYFAENPRLRPPPTWDAYRGYLRANRPRLPDRIGTAAYLLDEFRRADRFRDLNWVEVPRDFRRDTPRAYRELLDRRHELERAAERAARDDRRRVLGLPPGQGGIPPGKGAIPPGQAKKAPGIPPGQLNKALPPVPKVGKPGKAGPPPGQVKPKGPPPKQLPKAPQPKAKGGPPPGQVQPKAPPPKQPPKPPPQPKGKGGPPPGKGGGKGKGKDKD